MAGRDLAVLDRFDIGRRDVHGDKAVAEIARIAAQAHEVHLELLQAHLGRSIERRKGLRADNAGGGEAVAGLITLHRAIDIGIKHIAVADIRRKVAKLDEACTQRPHIGVAGAELQALVGGQRRMAAAGHELLVDADGTLQRLHRGRAENGMGRADVAGADRARIVALGPFGLATDHRRLLRESGQREARAEETCRSRKERAAVHPHSRKA